MSILLLVVVGGVLVLVIGGLLVFMMQGGASSTPSSGKARGSFADIRGYMAAMSGALKKGFLVIQIAETEDFVQLVPTEGGYMFDFPLSTARQRSLAPAVRDATGALGLPLETDEHSMRSQFSGDADRATELAIELLQRLFGASAATPLTFDYAGFEVH